MCPVSFQDKPVLLVLQVKSAFTRIYNKGQHKTHYAAAVSKKSRVSVPDHDDVTSDSEPESDPGLSQDRMVKVKTAVPVKPGTATASQGGGGAGGRGKGRKGRGKGTT